MPSTFGKTAADTLAPEVSARLSHSFQSSELFAEEHTLFVFEPPSRIVPTTITRITASIATVLVCPCSEDDAPQPLSALRFHHSPASVTHSGVSEVAAVGIWHRRRAFYCRPVCGLAFRFQPSGVNSFTLCAGIVNATLQMRRSRRIFWGPGGDLLRLAVRAKL
jgi:hypothetical protein